VLKRPGPRTLPKITARISRRALWCSLAAALILAAYLGYVQALKLQGISPKIQAHPTLKVITRISPNTYYETKNGPGGFEYTLLSQFANDIGAELKIETTATLANLFERVSAHKVDMASAALTPTPQRQQHFNFSEPYLHDQSIVVYRVGKLRPRNYRDLLNKDLVVISDSSHSQQLREMQQIHPDLQWRELNNVDYVDLLGRVEKGEVDYTIIDSAEFMLHRGAFPRVKRAFDFGESQAVSWMFDNSEQGKQLKMAADQFIRKIKANGMLAKLEERYFGQASHIDQVAANEFAKNIDTRLSFYINDIKQVAEDVGIDWQLLAAMSYQESGWDPLATSPTGVRGMMMLTRPTAKELGITDRLDLEQSLRGGAAYYLRLKKRLPDSIREPDRSWFALAAYNVGFGHLQDARKLATKRGLDKNSWISVKETLPLLTQPRWYRQTRHGYARGREPVNYVQQIRHYRNVLNWYTLSDSLLAEAANDDVGVLLAEFDTTNNPHAQWPPTPQIRVIPNTGQHSRSPAITSSPAINGKAISPTSSLPMSSRTLANVESDSTLAKPTGDQHGRL
jgi:membrane-bound lytic murein transglycosylase F